MSKPAHTGRYSTISEIDRTTFRPQLTSLIDMMTFLLVFLIKSFSVQGDVITPSTNLDLPISNVQKPPRIMASVEITRTTIMSDGKIVASLASFMKSDSMLIPALYHLMISRQHDLTSSQVHAILIQADRETEYSILKRVMYSCSKAGISDFTILAVQKE